MATHRTGTNEWKNNITPKVLKDAQSKGQYDCPYCGVELDYKNRTAPNGAQVDHILAVANGGTNEYHNLHVCCRTCNISKGKRNTPKRQTILNAQPLNTSRTW